MDKKEIVNREAKKEDVLFVKRIKDEAKRLKRESKRLRREYKRMCKTHRKNLLKEIASKDFGPWDYGHGVFLFVEFLKYMRDYYALGYNVFALDEDDDRLRTLQETIDAYEKYDAYQYLPYDHWDADEEERLRKRVYELIECNIRSWWD